MQNVAQETDGFKGTIITENISRMDRLKESRCILSTVSHFSLAINISTPLTHIYINIIIIININTGKELEIHIDILKLTIHNCDILSD